MRPAGHLFRQPGRRAPTIDLDADNSTGATAADFKGYFAAGAIVAAADTDTLITDNGTTIASAVIKLTTLRTAAPRRC